MSNTIKIGQQQTLWAICTLGTKILINYKIDPKLLKT